MLLIEVSVPRGALSEAERQALGQRLVDTLMAEDDSHAVELLEAQRTLTQVLVHEPATWVLGRRPAADPADPPRYLVRVTVPASWRKEMSAYTVETVTGVLAETERAAGRDPERLLREPDAVVLVDGVPEGGVGIYGRVMGSLDLTELISRPYRDGAAARPEPETPRGTLVDPVCGMRVDLEASTLTLVYEGTLYGFCHGLCRRSFADEHGVPLG
ncbi:YHS domain-containing protein [Streptomyces boncukensis]|uniref:YHS domain-containing protein n=1 Tax=Streptomyces boncukensis TaxID=2711219 RepID=A0A6G4WXG9_9ACTN|nr:YHS domain-containing protein [Streptomyces boncukensis]NGO69703.1 YHS domain-containing protein [Streptomyces boncukensis]